MALGQDKSVLNHYLDWLYKGVQQNGLFIE